MGRPAPGAAAAPWTTGQPGGQRCYDLTEEVACGKDSTCSYNAGGYCEDKQLTPAEKNEALTKKLMTCRAADCESIVSKSKAGCDEYNGNQCIGIAPPANTGSSTGAPGGQPGGASGGSASCKKIVAKLPKCGDKCTKEKCTTTKEGGWACKWDEDSVCGVEQGGSCGMLQEEKTCNVIGCKWEQGFCAENAAACKPLDKTACAQTTNKCAWADKIYCEGTATCTDIPKAKCTTSMYRIIGCTWGKPGTCISSSTGTGTGGSGTGSGEWMIAAFL